MPTRSKWHKSKIYMSKFQWKSQVRTAYPQTTHKLSMLDVYRTHQLDFSLYRVEYSRVIASFAWKIVLFGQMAVCAKYLKKARSDQRLVHKLIAKCIHIDINCVIHLTSTSNVMKIHENNRHGHVCAEYRFKNDKIHEIFHNTIINRE